LREYGAQVTFDEPAFIHDTVEIFGKNHIGKGVSIWPRVVMRAEMFENVIGPYSNLQDFVMVHVGSNCGTTVGAYCSITHRATIHGCTIGDNCLIGINATIMDDVVIGENSVVAGHTIVTQGTKIPPNSIVAGVPGKVIKTRNSFIANRMNALIYYRNGLAYAQGDHRGWDDDAARKAIAEEQGRVVEEFKRLYPDG
jgi:carbonic anhydrase/acetyltransferase-like protein (isoleucine patch superfamily)